MSVPTNSRDMRVLLLGLDADRRCTEVFRLNFIDAHEVLCVLGVCGEPWSFCLSVVACLINLAFTRLGVVEDFHPYVAIGSVQSCASITAECSCEARDDL